LRRRCKYIIAVDSEADANLRFGSLIKLIRYARINLGIEIDINLEYLRKRKDGFSCNHWTKGKIDYGQGEIGQLVYLKSSLTGDENEYVLDYHYRHPNFPHQSTADQFFDETQFEAYRALGYHIAHRAFQDENMEEVFKIFII
jgi:hypothetical protein